MLGRKQSDSATITIRRKNEAPEEEDEEEARHRYIPGVETKGT